MYKVSLAIYIIEPDFGGRNDDGWCVASGIDSKVAEFGNIAVWNAIRLPIILRLSYV